MEAAREEGADPGRVAFRTIWAFGVLKADLEDTDFLEFENNFELDGPAGVRGDANRLILGA